MSKRQWDDRELPRDTQITQTSTAISSRRQALLDWSRSIESTALRDGLRLIVIGGALEAARRGASYIFKSLYERLTITARFEQHDPSYDWLMAWLSVPERQRSARNFEIDTRGSVRREWSPEDGAMLLPTFDSARMVRFEGHLLRIVRAQNTQMFGNPSESVTITVFSRSQSIIHRLITTARKIHQERDHDRVIIHTPNTGLSSWNRSSSRHPRSMDSVILPKEAKERLRSDVEGFLGSEAWYADRGIPHRRGYLLYGPPGSGKTSVCTAIAGSLGLNLYVVSLAQKGLDDANLNALVGQCPSSSMILMEDIDCAFVNRSATSLNGDGSSNGGTSVQLTSRPALSDSGVTLSGLLNCLDGVAAQEGSMFFATTNHVEVLDPALSRPGRFDVWLEFHQATQTQARDLFLHFFPTHSTAATMLDSGTDEKYSQEFTLQQVLADKFANNIPDGAFSVAALQGYLMTFKGDPERASNDVGRWVSDSQKTKNS